MEDLIARIILSWEHSSDHHFFKPGASSNEIAAFEEEVGWQLPPSCRAVYQYANGISLMGGEVRIEPLQGGDFSVAKGSDFLRSNGWPIPPALWVAAYDGGGDPFGLWISPQTKKPANEIIATGKIFEPKCFSIAGSNLARFLLMRTAYYLLSYEAPSKALNTLGIPSELRSHDPEWSDILDWADPDRVGGPDIPYDAKLSSEQVADLVSHPII